MCFLPIYLCFNSNQTIFRVKTEKPKTEKIRDITQFRTRVFVFQFFSVQGGNSTDVKIHSSEVKMYSADVKIKVKIRNQQIAI